MFGIDNEILFVIYLLLTKTTEKKSCKSSLENFQKTAFPLEIKLVVLDLVGCNKLFLKTVSGTREGTEKKLYLKVRIQFQNVLVETEISRITTLTFFGMNSATW